MMGVNNGCPQPNYSHKPWKAKRAQIVSLPSETLVGHLGCTTMATVIILNDTNWPYKHGCVLKSYFTGLASESLKEVEMPLDTYVDAH